MQRGRKIRRIRDAKGWKQPDVVRSAKENGNHLQVSYLSKIETGKAANPTVTLLETIADALEVPKDAILVETFDDEIEKNPIGFVSRQSLDAFIQRNNIPENDAEALTEISKRGEAPPKDVRGWRALYTTLKIVKRHPDSAGTRNAKRGSRRPR